MTDLALISAIESPLPEVLQEVLRPDCNLAIWEREDPRGLTGLLDNAPKDVRFETTLSHLREALLQNMDAAGFFGLKVKKDLADDIQQLAEHFCAVLGLRELEVRLEIVTTNSCRKWHSDYVKARLITTYTGTGTQWLEAPDTYRVQRGFEPLRIREMSPGDVGIFKGRLATDNPAVHRSPPIEDSCGERLLLVLNPLEG